MQTLFIQMCRLSLAQKANGLLGLESIRNNSENDLEYQLLKTQVSQGFPVHKHELQKISSPLLECS